jgi:hypothetical protein
MATLLTLSLNRDKVQFNEKGWANITISIDDSTNQYGQNASGWNQQTKEEREAKEARAYVGNGKVVWTDGKIVVADKVEPQLSTSEQSMAGRETPDLPF